jgi:hypothetical protein
MNEIEADRADVAIDGAHFLRGAKVVVGQTIFSSASSRDAGGATSRRRRAGLAKTLTVKTIAKTIRGTQAHPVHT